MSKVGKIFSNITQSIRGTQKAAPKKQAEKAKAPAMEDYWVAGGKKFNDFESLGNAVKAGKLNMPKSGKLPVAHKGDRSAETPKLKSSSKKWGAAGLLATAGAFGLAAAGSALFIPALMAGGVALTVAHANNKVANDFMKKPHIKERGTMMVQNGNQNGNVKFISEFKA